LRASDGASASTTTLASLPNLGSDTRFAHDPRFLVSVGFGALFANTSRSGLTTSLWRTSGTAPSTVEIADLNPRVTAGSAPVLLATCGERVLFTAKDSASPAGSVWCSDGTSAGTVQITKNVPADAAIAWGESGFVFRGAGYLGSS